MSTEQKSVDIERWYDFSGKVAVITGGAGVLGRAMAHGLAERGARIVILSRRPERVQAAVASLEAKGAEAIGIPTDVLRPDALAEAAERTHKAFGRVDILINAAGGNRPEATATPDQPLFDLPPEAIEGVLGANLTGTIYASQAFGRQMAAQGEGSILNISSMAAIRPLTRVGIYGAAKAAIDNWTQWLAVHMAVNYSPKIRVNAIAPGFLLGEQNRYLLIDAKSGELTPRGREIIAHTPMRRFGEPADLIGTVLWLLSPAAAFVTGVVIPIDGGYAAFGGV
ncbi:MAG TPA: SDR family oxidoreductase [Limnochordia bacterium]